jgi:hypothetical protein
MFVYFGLMSDTSIKGIDIEMAIIRKPLHSRVNILLLFETQVTDAASLS